MKIRLTFLAAMFHLFRVWFLHGHPIIKGASTPYTLALYWTTDAILPPCFEKYEGSDRETDLDSANSKLFSNYKSRHTYKALIAWTPGATVSYISGVCGGEMSDVEVLRKSALLDKLTRNDKIMLKGFSNKNDFLIVGGRTYYWNPEERHSVHHI